MLKGNESKFLYLFSFALIMILGISVFVIDNYDKNKYEIIEHNSQINDKILWFKTSHGSSFIKLNNSRMVWISQSVNYEYDPSNFCENISVGDSLFKKSNNDTLYLVKKGKRYIFNIKEALNVPNWRNRK